MSTDDADVNTAAVDNADEATRPRLRVISGDATAEEIAALLAVLAAAGGGGAPAGDAGPRSEWASPARAVGGRHRPGPRGWAHSAWPR